MDYCFQIDYQFLLLVDLQAFIDLGFILVVAYLYHLGHWGGLVVDHVLAYLEAFLLSAYLGAFHHVTCLVAYHLFVAYWGSYHLSLEVDHHL